MYGDGIWEAMVTFFIICIIAAIGFGMLLMWAAPKAWEYIKPWIHAITA